MKLHEFFTLDVDLVMFEMQTAQVCHDKPMRIMLDPERKRLSSTVNVKPCSDPHEFKRLLEDLNKQALKECQDHLNHAIDNVLNGAKYERLDDKGPKIKLCNPDSPLICQYFTCPDHEDLAFLEQKMYQEEHAKSYMVHNGWVMGMDPSVDFANPESLVYFRRELVAWGDSVKLNYGTCPQDNPKVSLI